jgi:Family of unknown function (DUF5989)
MNDKRVNEFEKAAVEQRDIGLVREFWYLLWRTKKWWLAPILVVLMVFGVAMVLSGTALAPFIYTLF